MNLERITMTLDAETFYSLGIILIFAGMLIVFIAMVLLFLSSVKSGGKIRGGGAIIIGPFPIIFGTDKESVKTILLLSIALIAILMVMLTFFYLMFR
ncbi:MAG: DUF131 domain-containing protein [Candidatus Bathyarchaeia archaeon]